MPACPCAGVIPDSTRHDLLQEVSNLVESPTVVLGGFDPAFLALPRCGASAAGRLSGCTLGSAALPGSPDGSSASVCLPSLHLPSS
jgi:hypothetical protein